MAYLGTEPITAPTPGAQLHHIHFGVSRLFSMPVDSQHDWQSLLRWLKQQGTARLNGRIVSPPAVHGSSGVLI